MRVGLCPKEEPRETTAAGPASSQSSVPDSPQGGHWDCPSPFSLDAVPQSSVTDVMCLDLLGCEERSSSTGSAQPSLVASSPPGLQPTASPTPEEDVCSEDSDDIIFSPFLPRKKSPSPF
ncbi:IQ domain-containing protein E [Microtus ochrogaster]|nr:IQ domain-containing protein E [Microtus ochrogaster]